MDHQLLHIDLELHHKILLHYKINYHLDMDLRLIHIVLNLHRTILLLYKIIHHPGMEWFLVGTLLPHTVLFHRNKFYCRNFPQHMVLHQYYRHNCYLCHHKFRLLRDDSLHHHLYNHPLHIINLDIHLHQYPGHIILFPHCTLYNYLG